MGNLEKRLRKLEKDAKEFERVQNEMSKFLKGWSDYFEGRDKLNRIRDKKNEERDGAIGEVVRLLESVQKIGKSKALRKFVKETNKLQERGKEASKRYVA